jgi:hypothetical protein
MPLRFNQVIWLSKWIHKNSKFETKISDIYTFESVKQKSYIVYKIQKKIMFKCWKAYVLHVTLV